MICIGFGTNKKWVSKLIRWATRSSWSHVWVEYPSGIWGGRWVAHSQSEGVVKVPLEQIEVAYPTRKLYECNPNLENGFLWARTRISAKYDYGVIWNALLLVLYRATKWEWLWKIVAKNAARYSCSEFVCGILKAAGVEGTEGLDPELTTPGDLEKFCSGSNNFLVM